MKRRSKLKIITSFIVICFLSVSFNQYAVKSNPMDDPTSLCYGFIIPNSIFENKTLENEIFCKTRHLVNDLLREDITVYWTALNISLNVCEIGSSKEFEMFFEQGTFIVPFTGDDTADIKIITIVSNYNQSCEIEDNDLRVPVYLLIQQLTSMGRCLSNVKIVNYVNWLTCGASWFADVAYICGFLNFDFFRNIESRIKLKNSNYNLIIWPGQDCYYPSSYCFTEIMMGLYSGRNRAIRKFVYNGGGFIGSCYTVVMASRGMEGIATYPDVVLNNPNIPSLGFLSIADIVSAVGDVIFLEQKILDIDHPVVYGVDTYLVGGAGPGPRIVKVGENVNVIAKLVNDTTFGNPPSIISDKFGDGNVVVFCPHPEVSDPDTGPKFWNRHTKGTSNGKKLVTNAFYYATTNDEAEFTILESRKLSLIKDVWNKTIDSMCYLDKHEDIFNELKSDIDKSVKDVVEINNRINLILETIIQIGIDLDIDSTVVREIFYYAGAKYLLYCFDLAKKYLENTTITLEKIEKIYPLLKDDSNFVKQLKQLDNDLSSKSNMVQILLLRSSNNLDKIEDLLESYRHHPKIRKKIAKNVKINSHNIELLTDHIFRYMPGGYFNSLKFLRHHWYEYETYLVTN